MNADQIIKLMSSDELSVALEGVESAEQFITDYRSRSLLFLSFIALPTADPVIKGVVAQKIAQYDPVISDATCNLICTGGVNRFFFSVIDQIGAPSERIKEILELGFASEDEQVISCAIAICLKNGRNLAAF